MWNKSRGINTFWKHGHVRSSRWIIAGNTTLLSNRSAWYNSPTVQVFGLRTEGQDTAGMFEQLPGHCPHSRHQQFIQTLNPSFPRAHRVNPGTDTFTEWTQGQKHSLALFPPALSPSPGPIQWAIFVYALTVAECTPTLAECRGSGLCLWLLFVFLLRLQPTAVCDNVAIFFVVFLISHFGPFHRFRNDYSPLGNGRS